MPWLTRPGNDHLDTKLIAANTAKRDRGQPGPDGFC